MSYDCMQTNGGWNITNIGMIFAYLEVVDVLGVFVDGMTQMRGVARTVII